jgi:hypothetical protein
MIRDRRNGVGARRAKFYLDNLIEKIGGIGTPKANLLPTTS